MKNKKLIFILLLVVAGVSVWLRFSHPHHAVVADSVQSSTKKTVTVNHCVSNTKDKEVIVSLSQQHLWACSGQAEAYQAAVTTGAYSIEGDATPTGTWQVYAKQTDRYLDGSDAHGTWHDYVNYWIPFDGDVGFHDASWQTFPFGDLAKYATEGSHGCVHLPLSAAKWIYDWASVGTTVTVES